MGNKRRERGGKKRRLEKSAIPIKSHSKSSFHNISLSQSDPINPYDRDGILHCVDTE